MRLEHGSENYQKFVDTMYHEFTLCEQAFDKFFLLAGRNIVHDENEYEIKEKLYESYSTFIVHLYEFYHACFKRNIGDTANIQFEKLDKLLTAEVEKLMSNMCRLIQDGRAPSWANDLTYYQESVPQNFGEQFRNVRNNASHVDLRRIGGGSRPSLKEFMDSNHKFLFFLFDSARTTWSGKRNEPYQVDHISEFDLSSSD
jgi:hypothetical protein